MMATLHQIQAALQKNLAELVGNGVIVNGGSKVLPVNVGIGWPALKTLQNAARGSGPAIVSIYDRRIGMNSTRWSPFYYNEVEIKTELTSVVAPRVLNPGDTATITLGGNLQLNDAVSVILVAPGVIEFPFPDRVHPIVEAAQVVEANLESDTLASMAAAMAVAINGDARMSTWVTASSAGAVITLHSLGDHGPFVIGSNTGNIAAALREIGRRHRQFQISIWSRREDERQAISDPIEIWLAQTEINFGLQMPDQSWARLLYFLDYDIEDGTLQDAYRHDYLITMDYAVTVTDHLYSVLVPELDLLIEQFSMGGPPGPPPPPADVFDFDLVTEARVPLATEGRVHIAWRH